MLLELLVGKRLFNDPKDAQTPGHILLLRGGYIRQIGQGIFALMPLARKVVSRIEQIIREEMDEIGGQEILMPVVIPAELWMESGRYYSVGSELVRFKDRTDHACLLNMTHEEVVVDIARAHIDSYRQLPCMLYQIQTKFRDEPRSRGGLIRVREFTMKDAYSFHRTQEDLAEYYMQCHAAYARIFRRCGLKDVIDIESDTGIMGGSVAHEFMLINPVGEDTIFRCEGCGYRSNREVAVTSRTYEYDEPLLELKEAHTPGQKTIEDVAAFLGSTPERCCKAVAFMADDSPVIAFVRGDLEINQAKLKKVLGTANIRPMEEVDFQKTDIIAGYIGPVGMTEQARMVFDPSVVSTPNLIIGANRAEYHRTGFNFTRDCGTGATADISEVREGDPCPKCGRTLNATRGVEVGNIFQLGIKYSAAMKFLYKEEDGSERHPIMGCYGIGVGRTMACVVEESRDDHGPIWPISIAPYPVHICCLQAHEDAIRTAGKNLHDALKAVGREPVLDIRNVGAGFMFSDADLIGAPVRLIVSPRNLKKGAVEIKYRVTTPPEGLPTEAPLETAVEIVAGICDKLAEPYLH